LCGVGIIHSYIIRRRDSFVQMLWNNLSRDCRLAEAAGLVDYPIYIYYNIHLCIRNYIADTTTWVYFYFRHIRPIELATATSLIHNILFSMKKKTERIVCEFSRRKDGHACSVKVRRRRRTLEGKYDFSIHFTLFFYTIAVYEHFIGICVYVCVCVCVCKTATTA